MKEIYPAVVVKQIPLLVLEEKQEQENLLSIRLRVQSVEKELIQRQLNGAAIG